MDNPAILGRTRKGVEILKPSGFRQSLYILLLATLSINILSLALPIMTRQVYNRILPNEGIGTLDILIAGVCLAVILEAVLRLCRAYVIGRAGAAYEHRMACAAMGKVLNADLSRMGSYGIGENLNRMNSISKLKDFYNGYALTVLAELAFVPVFLGLIIYLAHSLAFIPATLLLAFIIISFRKGYCLRKALHDRELADDARFNYLIDSLEGVHTLKAFALEKFFERRYEVLEEKSTLTNYRVTQETADNFNIGAIFSQLMVVGVISAGSWLVLNGSLTTGSLIATLLLSGRMMQPIQKTLGLWMRYQDYKLARRHLEKLYTLPQQKTVSRDIISDVKPNGRLRLCNVAFQYQYSDEPLLKDINLELNRGESAYISGMHGAGKTTLLNLVSGIYPQVSGDIYIDGENINTFSPEILVNHVGYIRTKPLIFRGTVRDNITCFGQTKEKQAKEIAALLNVDKDVAKLPGGFDTFLNGNNTDSISQGLKQRIAIARVLATKPRLILFDSADRLLDKEGYALVYSLLARLKGKASMILVTEDRNIAALADRYYRLEDGRLSVEGNLANKGNVRPYKGG